MNLKGFINVYEDMNLNMNFINDDEEIIEFLEWERKPYTCRKRKIYQSL